MARLIDALKRHPDDKARFRAKARRCGVDPSWFGRTVKVSGRSAMTVVGLARGCCKEVTIVELRRATDNALLMASVEVVRAGLVK